MKTNFKIDNTMVEMKMEGQAHKLIDGKEFKSDELKSFIKNYLIEANIDGVLTPQISVANFDGNNEVAIYIFLETSSEYIISRDIKKFKELVAPSIKYRPSERLIEELSRFCDPESSKAIMIHPITKVRDVAYFKCDTAKVLCEFIESK